MASRRRAQLPDDSAFLSVIAWPDEVPRDALITQMATAASLDLATLRLRARRNPPLILGRLPHEQCDRAIAFLREHGGDGFAPTMAQLESFGPSRTIRDLRIEGGRIHLKPWRDEPVALVLSAMQVLVRARLSESKPRPATTATQIVTDVLTADVSTYAPAYWVAGGGYGLAAAFAADYLFSTPDSVAGLDPPRRLSHKLDIHTADNRIYQIDADKFGFAVLGELRGHSDNVNTDRLCELLVHLAPHATVDPYYSLWRPPPGHDSLRARSSAMQKDDPAFAFYSRWVTLMYRHLMSNERSSSNPG